MALTLLRHAALAPKYQGRYNGWTNLSIDHTRYTKSKVSLLQQQYFDKIYSSDLIRCQETLMVMGMEIYTTDTRLREVAFKPHIEGLNFEEIRRLPSYKEEYLQNQEAWHNYICAETQIDFEQRIKSFLADIPTNEEILICSHGGTLQKMMTMLGYAKESIDYLEWIRIENGI